MKIEQNSLISFFFIKIYVNTRSCVGDDVFFKFTQFFSIIYTKILFFFCTSTLSEFKFNCSKRSLTAG